MNGAIMANQDAGNLCEWLPLAHGLARAEHGTGILKSPNAQRVIRAVATFVRTRFFSR
jgi:hypothetical protein